MATAILAAPAARPVQLRLLPVQATRTGKWHHIGLVFTAADWRVIALFSTPLPGRRGRSAVANLHDAPAAIERHAVTVDGGELMTDARVALLRLSGDGPASLTLVDGQTAAWSGNAPFEVALGARAEDLHLDLAAQRRLSRQAAQQGSR